MGGRRTSYRAENTARSNEVRGVDVVIGMRVRLAAAGVVACCLVGGTAGAATPRLFKNCTNLNRKYPHGVGKVGARDHTSGDPVTNFKRSNALYRLAMSYNRGLDRDKDGIACEKQ
jgi:Excalibur calcium-binding domain